MRWLEFIDSHDNDLKEIGFEAGIKSDAPTTISVARWGYSNDLSSGGQDRSSLPSTNRLKALTWGCGYEASHLGQVLRQNQRF